MGLDGSPLLGIRVGDQRQGTAGQPYGAQYIQGVGWIDAEGNTIANRPSVRQGYDPNPPSQIHPFVSNPPIVPNPPSLPGPTSEPGPGDARPPGVSDPSRGRPELVDVPADPTDPTTSADPVNGGVVRGPGGTAPDEKLRKRATQLGRGEADVGPRDVTPDERLKARASKSPFGGGTTPRKVRELATGGGTPDDKLRRRASQSPFG